MKARDRLLDALLGASPFVSTLGLAGLFVTVALGFEEPNRALFAASGCLLLAAPVAVFVHAALTNHLTRMRRRTWLRALAGPKAMAAMSRYLQMRTRTR